MEGKYSCLTVVPIIYNTEKMASAENLCNPCETRSRYNEGSSWCMDCEEWLCDGCTEHHKSLKALKGHHLVNANIKKLHSFDASMPSLVCDLHNDNPLEYFCVDHDKVCCRDCLAESHKICKKTMSLESASKGSKECQRFKDCQEHLNIILQTCNSIEENREGKIQEMNACRVETKHKFSKIKQCFIEQVNELERKTTENLDTEVDKIVREYTEEKRRTMSRKESLQSYTKEMQFIGQHGSDKQAFLYTRSLDRLLQRTDSEMRKDIEQLKDQTISFSELKYALPQKFGDIQVHHKGSNIVYKSPTIKHAQMPAEKSKSLEIFELENKINVKDRVITGMCVTNDGKLFLCDYTYGGNGEVLVYTDTGNFIKAIKTSGRVWDIPVIPGTNKAVITHDSQLIEFINTETFTLDKKVTVSTGDKLTGIVSSRNFIFVGGKNKIHQLDTNGRMVGSIKIPNSRIVNYLALSNEDLLYYSTPQSFHCINLDGTEIFSNQIPGENNHRNIAIDKQSNIYVVGSSTSTIHRLSPDGKFDRVIMNSTNRLNIPNAICFNRTCEKLYVSNNIGKSILVFKCT